MFDVRTSRALATKPYAVMLLNFKGDGNEL